MCTQEILNMSFSILMLANYSLIAIKNKKRFLKNI